MTDRPNGRAFGETDEKTENQWIPEWIQSNLSEIQLLVICVDNYSSELAIDERHRSLIASELSHINSN